MNALIENARNVVFDLSEWVAVYGDGGNDIVMLDRFEHAYATSNGSDAAKRAAGNVIGNCAAHAVPRHMVATLRNDRNRTVIS